MNTNVKHTSAGGGFTQCGLLTHGLHVVGSWQMTTCRHCLQKGVASESIWAAATLDKLDLDDMRALLGRTNDLLAAIPDRHLDATMRAKISTMRREIATALSPPTETDKKGAAVAARVATYED